MFVVLGEPSVGVAIEEALDLGAVQVHHGWDTSQSGVRPVDASVERKEMGGVGNVILIVHVRGRPLGSFQGWTWEARGGYTLPVGVECCGCQISVQFLQ